MEIDMPWVTRDRPRIGRFVCPWRILRFTGLRVEFLSMPAPQQRAVTVRGADTSPLDLRPQAAGL
ncbi:MAG: hypothetical protein U1F07_18280 [Rubrivivax sp.]